MTEIRAGEKRVVKREHAKDSALVLEILTGQSGISADPQISSEPMYAKRLQFETTLLVVDDMKPSV